MAAWGEGADEYATENERVRSWNMERLVNDLRIDPATAALAAQADIDWHEVDRIVRRGCPSVLALEIVA